VRYPEDVPTLTDGVVSLRAHHEDDVPALLEQASDPVMVEWTTVPVPSSEESSRDFATKIVPSGWVQGSAWAFAVEALDDQGRPRFVGTVELRDREDRRAEIAYGAHPWARGRGLMERACRLLLEWGFTEKRLETVIWWANKGNWASRRLAWRLGFSVDGSLRHWLPHRGELLDAWVGVLLAGDERLPRGPWFDVPRIDGPTVSLRAFDRRDIGRIVEACRDERTAYWLSGLPSPYTPDDAVAYLDMGAEQCATGRGLHWAVVDPSTEELLASIALSDVRPGRHAEVGYWTHPAARGRGVMTAACRLAVRHAFVPAEDGGLGLRRLAVMHAEGNTASQRVIERNGFVPVGRERGAAGLGDGRVVDNLVYDLLAEEFRA
jgi:RimJ/RimL family protein N-acetyltransferase